MPNLGVKNTPTGRVAHLDRVSASEADLLQLTTRRSAIARTANELFLAGMARGMTPAEARARVVSRLGGRS